MQTKIYKLGATKPDDDKIKQAAELIKSGRFVAFPTETVYGLASRVNNETLNKLNTLKGRDAAKPYTLHIGNKTEAERFIPTFSRRARKLITGAWPGPLTIVFELSKNDIEKQQKMLEKEIFDNLYQNDTIGIRCPDHPVARLLLEETNIPVVAPSANITGRKPPICAKDVLEQLKDKIDLLLDCGATRYKKSSTVVKIGKIDYQILRQGAFHQQKLKDLMQLNFLFVCTGNTCRSPIAAALFKKHLAKKLGCRVDQIEEKGYKFLSAGTMGMAG